MALNSKGTISMNDKSQCETCKHYLSWDDEPPVFHRCKAFPNGIPEEIFQNRYDHKEPYPNDNGIHWQELIIYEETK
jgi:hypothetical protein